MLEATEVEKITVTGSRIRRDTFNSISPIQVITREETMLSGFNSTTAVLQCTVRHRRAAPRSTMRSAATSPTAARAPTPLALRGLGPTRTLVLLNGRRVAPAGSRGSVGSADLNVLPNAIVDRIEILKDGASSIYGSDAVAGVINIITARTSRASRSRRSTTTPRPAAARRSAFPRPVGFTGDRARFSRIVRVLRPQRH